MCHRDGTVDDTIVFYRGLVGRRENGLWLFEGFSRGGISLRPAGRNPGSLGVKGCHCSWLRCEELPNYSQKWEKFGLAFIVQMFVRLRGVLLRAPSSKPKRLVMFWLLCFLITLTMERCVVLQTRPKNNLETQLKGRSRSHDDGKKRTVHPRGVGDDYSRDGTELSNQLLY